MQQPDVKPQRARPLWGRALLGAVLLAVIGAAVVCIVSMLPSSADRTPEQPSYTPDQVIAALSTGPEDSAPVIGVSAGGRHRAYVLKAFRLNQTRIANDLLGEVPVTVTYCDLNDCVRVFTGPGKRQLRVGVGGLDRSRPKSMLLRIGPNVYWQDTGEPLRNDVGDEPPPPFPYSRLDFVRTTWKQWREAHPETDVYIGKVPAPTADPTPKVVTPAEKTARP